MTDVDQFSSSTAIDQESITKNQNDALQVSKPSKGVYGEFEVSDDGWTANVIRDSPDFADAAHGRIDRDDNAIGVDCNIGSGTYVFGGALDGYNDTDNGTLEVEAYKDLDVSKFEKLKVPFEIYSRGDTVTNEAEIRQDGTVLKSVSDSDGSEENKSGVLELDVSDLDSTRITAYMNVDDDNSSEVGGAMAVVDDVRAVNSEREKLYGVDR